MEHKPRVSIVAAISARNRAVGNKNDLLWHLPEDLKRFKSITLGHPVILGRKTYESILAILKKPLPGRTNIVVTRQTNYAVPEGVVVTHSLDEAFEKAAELDQSEIFIGGGPEMWTLSLPHVDRLYLTLVEDEPEADAFFPDYSEFSKQTSEKVVREEGGLRYTWVTLER